jgi:hypothetical protein
MMRNTRATLAEYRIWATMRNRCTSPQSAGFKDYGARGIRVCERWHTFGNFLADMGRRPSQRHALKRLDIRGNFAPHNCRWMTPEATAQLRRRALTGRRFSRLLVLDAVIADGVHVSRCRCRCDCGVETTVSARKLMQGVTRSCGCLKRETLVAAVMTHGERRGGARTAEYVTWFSMRHRCANPSHSRYASHGGRGIKVCARWQGKGGYAAFVAGAPPKPKASSAARGSRWRFLA